MISASRPAVILSTLLINQKAGSFARCSFGGGEWGDNGSCRDHPMPFNLSLLTDNRRQMVLPEPRETEDSRYNVQTDSTHRLSNFQTNGAKKTRRTWKRANRAGLELIKSPNRVQNESRHLRVWDKQNGKKKLGAERAGPSKLCQELLCLKWSVYLFIEGCS